jgi:signal transduction histidine kinase
MLARVRGVERRWLGVAIAVGSAIVVAALAERIAANAWISTIEPAVLGFLGAVAIIGAVSYLDRRDPALLLLAAGSAAVAGQFVLMRVIVPILWSFEPNRWRRLAVGSSYGIAVAFLVFAICLVFVVPWRERRGRPPLSPSIVTIAVAVSLIGFDAIILIANPTLPVPRITGLDTGLATPAIFLSGAAALAGLIAAARSLGGTSSRRWLAGASLAFTVAFAGMTLAYTTTSLRILEVGRAWGQMMLGLGAILVLAEILGSVRSQNTRMRRATDRAEEILGGRAEIASVISHDVRSPVSSIKSIAASTIANYDRLDDAQRLEFVGMIEREAQVALGIVHQMSVALRIDAGTVELVRRPTTVATVVRQAIDESETDDRRIEVEAAPGVTANVDAKWLAEAIRQGLDNAAAFSPGESSIRVGVEDAGEGAAAITIQDEGPGIPPERREEVFERFSRWRPQGYSDVPGSGLGLFICRGIVREHGGEATLENGAERGTILRILLPWSAD